MKFTGEKLGFVLRLTEKIKTEVTEKEEMIKMKTAKLGALFLVAIMGITAIGASYAHWEETLTIEGVMTTDDIDPYFHCIESNDVDNWDPAECGIWDIQTGWQGIRRVKDVGSCTVQMGETTNELEIAINDAYPCYYAHPKFCISNAGSCPVNVYGVKLVEVSYQKPEWATPVKIPVNKEMLVDDAFGIEIYQNAAGAWKAKFHDEVNNAKDDFSLMLTGCDLSVPTQLDPWRWGNDDGYTVDDHMQVPGNYKDTLYGDLCIHFENGCEELTTYDFVIELVFWNWPELEQPVDA